MTMLSSLAITFSLSVHWRILMWALYVVMLILLVLPALSFLFRGWAVRRKDILGAFADTASFYYLLTFHPDYLEIKDNVSKRQLKASRDNAKRCMEEYYEDQYGRVSFCAPLVLCLVAAAILLGLCTDTAIDVLALGTRGLLPGEAVAAIMGAYMWVVTDQISLSSRDNLSQSDLYWACFRLVLAVPLAYALSQVAAPSLAVPISFLLGTFPTKTVMTFSRSALEKMMIRGESDRARENPLKRLRSVDSTVADRFNAEGITTIFQLANSDPVKLAIRTGMGFSYILDCCGQALLWNYAGEKIDMFQSFGIIGVYEVRSLWKKLKKENTDRQTRAKAIVEELRKGLGLAEPVMLNMLEEIAKNPNTIFQHNTWMTGIGPVGQSDDDDGVISQAIESSQSGVKGS